MPRGRPDPAALLPVVGKAIAAGLRLLALTRDEERLMSADERKKVLEAKHSRRFYLDRGGRTFPKRIPEALVRQAAASGDAGAVTLLGRLRERYGLVAEAQSLYRDAIRLAGVSGLAY